jgi:hypothetical protein
MVRGWGVRWWLPMVPMVGCAIVYVTCKKYVGK